jgi:hypothetical protein
MADERELLPGQILDIWLTVTQRRLSPKQRATFLARTEIPQLVTYLRRHGRTWLEANARRSVRGRGRTAQLRLADWIASVRDYSARSQPEPPPAPRPRKVAGLRPPQQYDDET